MRRDRVFLGLAEIAANFPFFSFLLLSRSRIRFVAAVQSFRLIYKPMMNAIPNFYYHQHHILVKLCLDVLFKIVKAITQGTRQEAKNAT